MLRRTLPILLTALALLAFAGCGRGSVSHEQVQKQLEAIQSLAAEGALVADGAADDRTTHVFVRVHTGYLDDAPRNVATKLSSASSTGAVERDREGRRCGNVDDLEIEGFRSGRPRVAAILVGPPVWRGRGLLGRVAAFIARGGTVRVPWEEVEKIDAALHLRKTARELRLGLGDDRARKWVKWIPGS